jgi:MtN3 and saliva related transmembrane protein
MNLPEWIGILASFGTGLSLLPQFLKILKEKNCESVSTMWLLVLLAGLLLWVWYGLLKKDWIIIISNSFSILVNLGICVLMLLYRKRVRQNPV